MEKLATARAVENSGLQGCAHARSGGKRQVLLVDAETLGSLNLVPGIIRENITAQDLDVDALQVGQKLRMGSVVSGGQRRLRTLRVMEAIRPVCNKNCRGDAGCCCRVLSAAR